MKIALYHNLHSGGAKRVVAEHAARLAARHDVTVFSLSTADRAFAQTGTAPASEAVSPFEPIAYLKSPFGRLNPLITLARVGQLLASGRETAAAIDRGGFDVVLTHPCQYTQTPTLLGWLATPSLYYCHELPRALYEPRVPRPLSGRERFRTLVNTMDPLRPLTASGLRRVDRWAARHATSIVTNSVTTQKTVTGAYRRQSAVCYPGVQVSDSPEQIVMVRERVVLSVGALTPNKGFDFIIRSLATLPPQQRPPLVVISNYQEPGEREFIVGLATRLGVMLTCLVNVPESELQQWYVRAGCVAYAPVREPLGLVALEAMAAGAPLVGVDEGGVTETVVDGSTGLLAPRDATRFGWAVDQLVSDPQKAQAMGQAARKHVREHWTWQRHVTQLEALLEATARARPGRRQARDGV